MASDEELRLVNEVDELQSQLKHAGDPIDPKLSEYFYESIRNKSTAEKIAKWSDRVDYFRKRLERASARAVVSPVVVHQDLQQHEAVPIGFKRKELPEPEIYSYIRPSKKVKEPRRKNAYRETIDGSPPTMNPNHVYFIRFCVDQLKKDCKIQQNMLIHNFMAANPDGETKFADSLFLNGYITTEQLLRISQGELPLPIAKDVLSNGREKKVAECARGQQADGCLKRRRLPPGAAALRQREADGGRRSGQGSNGEPDR